MNARGETALVAAAIRGVRQIKGAFADSHGGRCAQGVLAEAAGALNPPYVRRVIDRFGRIHTIETEWITDRAVVRGVVDKDGTLYVEAE